ncbi:MAG: S41 family peptidase [Armatimonadetes bacterium]|nr:S41 family peptidase [Armatimonadota bacterium]
MKARLRSLFVVLACFVALQTSAFAAKPAAYDGVATVSRLASLVENEYLEKIPQSRLMSGAFKGMRTYLQKEGYSASLVPASGTSRYTVADFRKVYNDVLRRYPQVSPKQLSFAAIRAMLQTLDDPYTVFLDPEEYKSLIGQLNGVNFGGLGIYIELDEKNNNALTVVEPMEGTPAMEAGIKPRDVILEIGTKATAGMSLEDATRLLRGPVGTPVTLTIKRAGEKDLVKISLKRAIIQSKTLSYKILDSGIGYIKLRVFGETANEDLDEAFRLFDRQNVKAYVLDLRNNGGGYITAALDVSSKFLPTGSRVVTVAERGQPEIVYNSRPNLRDNQPLVVLVNKYSASASEITAGALKDLHGAILLGEKTFGKGSVQKIFPLNDGSAVKITTAHYRTPSGQDIHKKGIAPDVSITMKLEDVGSEKDGQLTAAVALLKQKMALNAERLASRASADAATQPIADAIRVKSASEEFEYVANLRCGDGGTFQIESQRLISEGGRYYDEVVVKCDRSGETRTLHFEIDFISK